MDKDKLALYGNCISVLSSNGKAFGFVLLTAPPPPRHSVFQAIESAIGGNAYQHSKVNQWTTNVVEQTLSQLTKLGKPFKYIGNRFFPSRIYWWWCFKHWSEASLVSEEWVWLCGARAQSSLERRVPSVVRVILGCNRHKLACLAAGAIAGHA